MITSPLFLLPRHPHGDLVTVIICIGFCFIIGKTHLPFLRYHGALILTIVVDIIFNRGGWAILDSLVNGLLFEEDFSLSPICVVELLNIITRRGVEDQKTKNFT